MPELNLEPIRPLLEQLSTHPIYGAIRTLADLRVFMSHHVFSVWDYMSLIKYLQRHIAPVQVPWIPQGDPSLRYFINRLVLEQESEPTPSAGGEPRYSSQFEYYCEAMREIGADAERPRRFLALIAEQGLDAALYSDLVPLPARYFTETTFGFIREDKPHLVAAALAVGRERVIPSMYRRLLGRMTLGPDQAPAFHYYLNRHVHLDEDYRAPFSLALVEALCGQDPGRIEEAQTAAEEAICARLRLWDGVLEAIETGRAT